MPAASGMPLDYLESRLPENQLPEHAKNANDPLPPGAGWIWQWEAQSKPTRVWRYADILV
jgi:hypothetical protein